MPPEKTRCAATLCALFALAPTAFAQSFPNKPLHLIVPYPAGGATDMMGRLLAQKLSEGFKQQVVVEAVAVSMGTTKSAVSRLEAANRHVPSVASLKKYAEAVGCRLKIEFVPCSPKRRAAA